MTTQTTVTAQVQEAITSAHQGINAAGQLAPGDEKQLREMSADIKAKLDDLTAAQHVLSNYLLENGKRPDYS